MITVRGKGRRGQTSLLLLSWPGQLGMMCLWHLVVGPPTGGHKEVVRRGHGGGEGEVVRSEYGGGEGDGEERTWWGRGGGGEERTWWAGGRREGR